MLSIAAMIAIQSLEFSFKKCQTFLSTEAYCLSLKFALKIKGSLKARSYKLYDITKIVCNNLCYTSDRLQNVIEMLVKPFGHTVFILFPTSFQLCQQQTQRQTSVQCTLRIILQRIGHSKLSSKRQMSTECFRLSLVG